MTLMTSFSFNAQVHRLRSTRERDRFPREKTSGVLAYIRCVNRVDLVSYTVTLIRDHYRRRPRREREAIRPFRRGGESRPDQGSWGSSPSSAICAACAEYIRASRYRNCLLYIIYNIYAEWRLLQRYRRARAPARTCLYIFPRIPPRMLLRNISQNLRAYVIVTYSAVHISDRIDSPAAHCAFFPDIFFSARGAGEGGGGDRKIFLFFWVPRIYIHVYRQRYLRVH